MDSEGNSYFDPVFNETVSIVEFDEGSDSGMFFMYVFLAAGVILLLFLVYTLATRDPHCLPETVLSLNTMASGGRTSSSLPDWAKSLECPVCLNTIEDPPIYLCEKGHGLCNTCRETIKAQNKPCPVCRGKLTDVRNMACEDMLKNLPKIRCKHNGCTFQRLDAQLVKIHEDEECKEKLVQCKLCPQSIALSQLFSHLKTKHQQRPNTVKLSARHVGKLLEKYGCEFITNLTIYDENVSLSWVSLCGPPKEARKYEYTVKIASSEEAADAGKFILVGTGDCTSCVVSREEFLKPPKEAVFISRRILQENWILDWNIGIKKK